MILVYFKQAWQILSENRLVNGISIAGTALSVAAIMLIVLIFQVRTAGYAPESERGRMLHVIVTEASNKEGTSKTKDYMSVQVLRELFYKLKTPEAVSGYADMDYPVSLPSKRLFRQYPVKLTDDAFWRIFDFSFLEGAPFTAADCSSALPKAVISDRLAKRLYGSSTGVTGRTLIMNFVTYTVVGVVKRPSDAARTSAADIWVPYSTDEEIIKPMPSVCENLTGSFCVVMLASSKRDFEAINREFKSKTSQYNASLKEFHLNYNDPQTVYDRMINPYGFAWQTWKDYFVHTGGLLLFLLLLPALNMIGVAMTSFRKRRSEIGVRKAFGATTGDICRQVLYENCLITLLGGIIGLFLSFGLLSVCRNFLLDDDVTLSTDMLLRPGAFVAAVFFSLLLNLLSAGWPAWRAGRMSIVQSLNNQE